MKVNDKKELHAKSVSELKKLINDTYNTVRELKLDNVQNKLKNTRSIFNTRKELAVMQSILSMKLATKEEEKAPATEEKAPKAAKTSAKK